MDNKKLTERAYALRDIVLGILDEGSKFDSDNWLSADRESPLTNQYASGPGISKNLHISNSLDTFGDDLGLNVIAYHYNQKGKHSYLTTGKVSKYSELMSREVPLDKTGEYDKDLEAHFRVEKLLRTLRNSAIENKDEPTRIYFGFDFYGTPYNVYADIGGEIKSVLICDMDKDEARDFPEKDAIHDILYDSMGQKLKFSGTLNIHRGETPLDRASYGVLLSGEVAYQD